MTTQLRNPVANPRLGTLYAIFSSALVGSLMLMIIGERLGLERAWLNHIVTFIPLILAATIGTLSYTNHAAEFFTSGNRVPPSFSGFALATTSLGGTGLLSLTGLFFLLGLDATSFILGWFLGFALMAMLFAPHIKAENAASLPDYFFRRFDDRLTAVTAAVLTIPPALLLLIAEVKIGLFAASIMTGLSTEVILLIIGSLVLLATLPGGSRSLTWSSAAYFIVMCLGFLLPLFIISVYLTNLPLPQFTYGTLIGELSQIERANGLTDTVAKSLPWALGGTTPILVDTPFLQSFGALSGTNYYFLLVCTLCGTATLPALLVRANTVGTQLHAQRAAGWGLALIGIILISAPAYAVFTKYMLFQGVIGAAVDQLPGWARDIVTLKLIEIRDDDQNAVVSIKELFVTRDAVAFLLPILAGLPFALIVITVTAALAASIASASAQTFLIGSSLVRPTSQSLATPSKKIPTSITRSRGVMVGAIFIGIWLALQTDADPFWLMIWALSLSASTFFAPMLCAITQKNFGPRGAISGMIAGFCSAGTFILLSPADGAVLSHLVAAIVGIPISFAAAFATTWSSA